MVAFAPGTIDDPVETGAEKGKKQEEISVFPSWHSHSPRFRVPGLYEEIFPRRSGYPLKKIEKNEEFNRKKIIITNNKSFFMIHRIINNEE